MGDRRAILSSGCRDRDRGCSGRSARYRLRRGAATTARNAGERDQQNEKRHRQEESTELSFPRCKPERKTSTQGACVDESRRPEHHCSCRRCLLTLMAAVTGFPATLIGDASQDARAGRPEQLTVTEPANPASGVMVSMYLAADPAVTVCEPGVNATSKSVIAWLSSAEVAPVKFESPEYVTDKECTPTARLDKSNIAPPDASRVCFEIEEFPSESETRTCRDFGTIPRRP